MLALLCFSLRDVLVDGKRKLTTMDKEDAVEKKLKLLNKPAVKTIQVELKFRKQLQPFNILFLFSFMQHILLFLTMVVPFYLQLYIYILIILYKLNVWYKS